ncbi:hypothetical protein BCV70DRAFT_198713 [Testicularia cyperi]|uniref:Ribosomal RNA-processing protein 43 n=1 Tax=Testicularia cyperi TaxID=1882483 RepID=A0A317XYR1_9BASI|nr:hypothetical protein BCV70DRAFT_198713 [Testicularia cyperi]
MGPNHASGSGSQSSDAVATTFKRLHPKAYLSRFLDDAIREDGRRLTSFRDTTVLLGSISTADGSAFIRIGNTSCVAAVKAEVAVPQLSRPGEGYLIPNVELPAVCSSRFKPGAPGTEAQILTDRLLGFLNSSNVLDRQQLCIEPGRAAWCLYLDISFICFDGNAIDAAVLAAMSALSDTRLPTAVFDPDLESTRCSADKARLQSLKLERLSLCASFGIFDGVHLLSDPTAFETAFLSSHLSIGIQTAAVEVDSEAEQEEPSRLSYLWQSGSSTTSKHNDSARVSDQTNLQTCMELARQRCQYLRTLLLQAKHAA